MEERESNSSLNSKQTDDLDQASKIVSSVIHEYDVINEDEGSNDGRDGNNYSASASSQKIPKNSMSGKPRADSGPINEEQISSRNRLSSSDRSNTITSDHVYVLNYPRVNCAEKIIICLDASSEMEKLTFRSRAGDKYSPKQLAKRGLNIFLQSKHRLDKKHEFALVLLHETAAWMRDFSNNPRDIQVAVEDITDTRFCDSCDVGSVFDRIVEHVDIPHVEGDAATLPPPFIVRVIFIYGRSNCRMQFSHKESFNLLNSSPYFFLDAIYLHEPPSEENMCQEVFDNLCDLDQKGLAYIFGASRNQTKFYDHMAQFLAHPLQRPLQNDVAYRIGSSVPSTLPSTLPSVVPENG